MGARFRPIICMRAGGIICIGIASWRVRKESSFSEEKEAKRLFSLGVRGRASVGAKDQQSFASFLQKRSIFL
jgi:hypothetical protein